MKGAVEKGLYPSLLLILFLIAELVVQPYGEFPLNDDWSYTKSVHVFLHEGRIFIGDWGAMTLATNIYWGGLICKILGYSFLSLRISTLVMALAAVLLLYGSAVKLGASKFVAFTAALALMFNPYFFSLSNTFMTDVNFVALTLAGIYTALCFFRSQQPILLLPLMVVSFALVLLRQYGLFFPFCFFICCLMYRQNRLVNSLLALFIFAGTILVFRYYETYLKTIVSPFAMYEFIFYSSEKQQDFAERLFYNIPRRTFSIIQQMLIYGSPAAVLYLVANLKSFGRRTVLCCAIPALVAAVMLAKDPLQGNIFVNMHLGAETFFESIYPTHGVAGHTYSYTFELVAAVLAVLLCGISLAAVFLKAVEIYQSRKIPHQGLMLLFLLIAVYTGLLFVTESYIDRYHLPLIVLVLLVFAGGNNIITKRFRWLPLILIALFVYVSVAGTRDYFVLNRLRWKAYNYLVDDLKVPHRTIHAGFEAKCWDRGAYSWWQTIENLENDQYLIQYSPAPGFREMRAYNFRRTFPPRSDKIYIFERSDENSESHKP